MNRRELFARLAAIACTAPFQPFQPEFAFTDRLNVVTVAGAAPIGPNLGDLWVELDRDQRQTGVKLWNGRTWATIPA